MKRLWLLAVLTALLVGVAATAAFAGPLPGAIFTTLEDGSRVNANIYEAKEDVYLDGGPGPHAPVTAAGLPEGDYYFQVTDPSGKVLLSVDPVLSRKVHVNEYGVISSVYLAPTLTKYKGTWYGTHLTGIDLDHGGDPWYAITVQLMPYENTPNHGGVYKVWMTPVEQFVGNPALVDNPEYFHGFVPAWSKTDNYKVQRHGGPPGPGPALMTVLKFHDMDADGAKDLLEPYVEGWEVEVTDPLGVVNTVYTPAVVIADPIGLYSFLEATPAGTQQTASFVDALATTPFPKNPVSVTVATGDSASHEIVFGNVGLGKIIATKIYDRNGDGITGCDEPGVPGWKFVVTGTLASGVAYGPVTITTGADGSVTLSGLLPGTYTVTELMPLGECWKPSGPVSKTVEIVSTLDGSVMTGSTTWATFTNYCEGYADFFTKGFWHNKNGLTILTANPTWILYVNGLDPYDSPTDYFGEGDEPFDGYFADGTPVAEAFNDDGTSAWGAGTWQAEVSHFLVDANAGGDPREQLAQQLLAFIFNVKYSGASAVNGMGSPMDVDEMIADAIEAWQTGGEQANYWQGILVGYNESDSVHIIHYYPCDVIYP